MGGTRSRALVARFTYKVGTVLLTTACEHSRYVGCVVASLLLPVSHVYTSHLLTGLRDPDPRAATWPPKDPNAYPSSDPNHVFTLPESPWTYENGSYNPSLEPSNAARRRRRHANVPPYHPDYEEQAGVDSASEPEDALDRWAERQPRVRRGSEGYEVRAIDREEVLRKYIESRGEDVGRYKRYVPEPPSELGSSSEGEKETLTERVEKWRSAEAIA